MTFKLDRLPLFSSPLSYNDAKYLLWKSSTILILRSPIQEHSNNFKAFHACSKYPSFTVLIYKGHYIHLWPFQMEVLLIIVQILASIKFCDITNLLSTKPPWALPVMSDSWRQTKKVTRNVIVTFLCEILTYWYFFHLLAMGEEEMSKQLRMWTAKSCF